MELIYSTNDRSIIDLYVNVLITKIVTTGDIADVTVDEIFVEVGTNSICLGSLILKIGYEYATKRYAKEL